MAAKALFFIAISLLFAGCYCSDPDCSKLSLGDDTYGDDDSTSSPVTTPPPGVLPTAAPGDTTVNNICPMLKGQRQCCSSSYFNNERDKLRNRDLKNGFGMQAQPQIGLFRSLARDVNLYYMNTLNQDIAGQFGNQVMPNATTLNTNPAADRFNPAIAVLSTLGGLIKSIKDYNSKFNKTCIDLQSQATIQANQAALAAFAKDIASLRNASTLFYFIDQYLQNVTDTLITMVPPTDQCANVLMKLTCAKCQKPIAKLCGSLCSAAAKGCFAPYLAALNPQFDILWNVTAQLVQFLNYTLSDMFAQQNTIRQALITDLTSVCNITLGSTLNINIRPHGVGVGFLKQAQRLLGSGLLSYNGSGALFCSAKTAKSKCWNGEVEMNEDGQEFSAEGIRGQANNPAGPFDENELTHHAQMLGTPVNNFFSTPNVSLVTPAAITIPQGQVYTGGVATLGTSLLLVFFAVLLSLF